MLYGGGLPKNPSFNQKTPAFGFFWILSGGILALLRLFGVPHQPHSSQSG
ncbi:hypothetical protein HAL09_13020 [Helicobacter ailurogastricus]|uniref:Uncharacterized protein n=1 Tax=Helicobacter ailurogastricus TaxID=1578720 RepID=A0A0K2XDT4_9HELI|nr:hypothetical protein HAL011_08960 [Helicobacter ailurogastricus]CRF44697.1 hypothetical protein HAL09_13020 [Helicobacter ailurogastricus]